MKYINLPDPELYIEEYNEYLRKNNEVISETYYWICIRNSSIENQLVVFYKSNARYLYQIAEEAFLDLKSHLSSFAEKGWYINADEDKSIPDRLHLHIKL